MNTDPHATAKATVPLTRAVQDLESMRGASWAWNPRRWRTHDGYVDYHSFLDAWKAERRHRAVLRLEAAAAFRLGAGGDAVAGHVAAAEREARGDE